MISTIFCCVSKIASNLTLLSTPVANLFSVVGGAPLLCLFGSRLLIGMKEAGARDVNLASGASSTLMVKTISQMQFMGGNLPISEQERSGFSSSRSHTGVEDPITKAKLDDKV